MPLSYQQKAHRLAGLVYLLYTLSFLFGITAIIGVIINHTLLRKTRYTYAYSHFVWQIISFWVLFAGIAVSVILWPGGPATAVAFCTLLWWIGSGLFGVRYLLKKHKIPFLSNE
ncbi:hypothetical protein AB833_14225 [Chromatiales bacterium (ex Bugula neritina AB1)]|nr:hypothetical protein AB833_14225 [Chromatiales bacterium (ex Bugula neritina AB1)]